MITRPRVSRALSAASALLCAIALLAVDAVATPAQAQEAAAAGSRGRQADPFELMKDDLREKRYAQVITRGNDLLGSSRAFSLAEQMLLWQVMAAAYYPADVSAQQPDSARLPLDALVRLAPDVMLQHALSWSGLDSLLERSRAAVFAVVARPQVEYSVSPGEPAAITVVATRPARFRLTSISSATGVAVVHDSSDASRSASLRLRAHDGLRPILTNGDHLLQVIAVDVSTGDSTVITRRARARSTGATAAAPVPPFIPPSTVRVSGTRRGAMLAGGLAFAGATIAIAQGARAQEPIRSGYTADGRAMIVGAAMLGAAVTGLFLDKGRQRPTDDAEIARARAAYDRRVAAAAADARDRAARFRVTLTVDQEDR